jgi:hypothetical protein
MTRELDEQFLAWGGLGRIVFHCQQQFFPGSAAEELFRSGNTADPVVWG